MNKSLIFALLGLILPSFVYKYSSLGSDSFALVGIGWIWLFTSSILGNSNFFGVYVSDPSILITPNDWIGFQSIEGLGAEVFVRSFFSDLLNGNNSISIYGLLFTIGLIAGIIGLILLFGNKKAGSALLIASGILGLIALLLFNQSA
ncbi:MAG: hypothetical protein ACW981_19335, partial [Candidatus Hodarchaeales archaeon]